MDDQQKKQQQHDFSPVPAHHNLSIPFASDIPGGVFPGKAILIKGVVLNSHSEHRFSVDLCCGKLVHGEHQDDKALHINPRFDHGVSLFSKPDKDIVINSLVNNVWGVEQRNVNSLQIGKAFSIRVLMLRDYFKISVNGRHLNDFVHRIPLENIKCIFIAGCVSVDLVEYQGTRPGSSPACPELTDGVSSHGELACPVEVVKPDVPFVYKLAEGEDSRSGGGGFFLPPREVLLILTPLLNAISFTVNFLCEDQEFLFHMRVDFPSEKNGNDRGAVVRNSTAHGGQWQREERQMGRFPFLPGITADLRIVAGSGSELKVLVDGCHFCEFRYRSPGPVPTQLAKITVTGDVSLQKFVFREREI